MMKSSVLRIDPLFGLAAIIVARYSCVALTNIPIFSIKFIFVYMMGFVLLYVLGNRSIKHEELGMFGCLMVYVLDVVYVTYTHTYNLFNTQAFNCYIMVALFFMYLWLKDSADKTKKRIITISLTGYSFTYIYSVIKLAQDPMLSRKAAASIVTENSVDTLNAIGGFDTTYGSLLIVCVLLFMFASIPKGKSGLACWTALSIGTIFIVMATYTIALGLLAIIWIWWIARRNKGLAFIVLLVLIVALIRHEELGQLLMDYSDSITYSKTMAEKIHEVGYMIKTGEAAGTLAGDEGRMARIEWSWDAFQKYPIFGAYGQYDVKIGGHSEVFDTLARFGLIGFLSLFCFWVSLYKDTRRRIHSRAGIICLNTVYGIYFLTSVLDPSLYTQMILPLFLIVPFFEESMQPNNDSKRISMHLS